jgi:hypothetical protein
MSVDGLGRRVRPIAGKVWRLSAQDWAELAKALTVAVAIEVGLRTAKLPNLARALGVPLRTEGARPAVPMVSWLPAWAMRRLYLSSLVMDVWPFGGSCLRRSLLVGQRLRTLGPVLRVGVARSGSTLNAHAWVEIDGRYFDPDAVRYAALEDLG